ncbi:Protein tyrosine phosphatase type IVA 2 [Sciurus carolinensis]|uniref:Protein tyrosine phosphatase type IVA 2 n=1 Tax=Sciurus carolinensis TaxID=30640 RepID=A0AA41NG80_SCICA|nr:Protein tyrosine phosphatase type IVA 2 [Sciurus carolinensis]
MIALQNTGVNLPKIRLRAPVEKEGIHLLTWSFEDGAPPFHWIVDDWLKLLKIRFHEEPGCRVVLYHVTGLGREPVRVVLALVKCGMNYEDAVQFIRQKRILSSCFTHAKTGVILPKIRLRAPVEKEGIYLLTWSFEDGAPPFHRIVDDWLKLLKIRFHEEPGCHVVLYHVTGLGREPVRVVLALVKCGMNFEDAVQFIRQKRILSSCFTWGTTDLKCDYASEIPMNIADTEIQTKASMIVAFRRNSWYLEM